MPQNKISGPQTSPTQTRPISKETAGPNKSKEEEVKLPKVPNCECMYLSPLRMDLTKLLKGVKPNIEKVKPNAHYSEHVMLPPRKNGEFFRSDSLSLPKSFQPSEKIIDSIIKPTR